MKTISWSRRQFRQIAGASTLLAGVLAAVVSANAQQTNAPAKSADATKPAAAKPAEADDTELVNWVDVSVGGNMVTGDKAQFQHQSGLPASPFGGISAFHYELPIGKKGTFQADGRGIFDNHDYDIKLEASNPEIGYVKSGFRQYREYYDGSGGYFPGTGRYFSLRNNELSLDRGTAFFEAGLTLPDLPVFKVRYEHDYRNGAKDSTEWGTYISAAAGTVQRKVNTAYLLLDEKTDILSADLTHTLGNTDLGLSVAYMWQYNNDSGNKAMQPAFNGPTQLLTQTERDKIDTLAAHAFTDTRINEKVELTTGYEYTSLRSSVAGSRLDTPYAPASPDTRFVNLAGGQDLDQYTMNLSMMYSPNDNWHIIPAFRAEKEIIGGGDGYNLLSAATSLPGAQTVSRDNENQLNFAESLDVRYVGVTNWVFYARGEWEENRALLDQFQSATPIPAELIDQDWHQLMQKYSIGANWYPQRGLNFAASAYHKIDNNNYNIDFTAAANQYPGFLRQQNFITDGATFRTTWRPLSQLTLVSRYDFAYSTIDTRGYQLLLVPSANTTTHMFGESVSWTPLARLYMQAGLNYVLNTLNTPADNITGGVVSRSQNDYWTFNTLFGYAFDDKTDGQVGYTYYRSADYSNISALPSIDGGTAPGGVPYGAGSEEHNVNATLGRQIRKNLRATLRYDFTSYRDQLFASNHDYRAHTILASLQYRF